MINLLSTVVFDPTSCPRPRACVPSWQIYVCTDEDNNLAEIRFYCDPDTKGNGQCYKEAGRLNVDALSINVRADMCVHCFRSP